MVYKKRHSFWNQQTLLQVSAISLGIFLVLVGLVHYQSDFLAKLDESVFQSISANQGPNQLEFFNWVTGLADPLSQIGITSLVVILLLSVGRWKAGLWYGLTVLLGAYFLNTFMKNLIGRQRPPFAQGTSPSFPSNHAMGAMIIFLSLAFVVHSLHRKHKTLILVVKSLCLIAILLIGISRIYLGAHYFSDILAGFALGLSFTSLSIALFGLNMI